MKERQNKREEKGMKRIKTKKTNKEVEKDKQRMERDRS